MTDSAWSCEVLLALKSCIGTPKSLSFSSSLSIFDRCWLKAGCDRRRHVNQGINRCVWSLAKTENENEDEDEKRLGEQGSIGFQPVSGLLNRYRSRRRYRSLIIDHCWLKAGLRSEETRQPRHQPLRLVTRKDRERERGRERLGEQGPRPFLEAAIGPAPATHRIDA
jgi:hypothetical protein